MTTHIYVCPNKRCSQHRREILTAMSPREFRAATGCFVRCGHCGEAMSYRPQLQPVITGKGIKP